MLLQRRNVIFFITAAILIVVYLIFYYFSSLKTNYNQSQQVNNSSSIQPPVVSSVSPDKGAILVSNQKQKFVITFTTAFNPKSITIVLQKNDIYKQDSPVPVNYSTSYSGNMLTISFSENVQPGFDYKFTLLYQPTNSLLFEAIYSVMQPLPTPQPNNNTSLAQYLPMKTDSWSLSYWQPENIYIFSFFYDPNSPNNLVVQRQNAEAAMNQFIQSKGIDPSTVKIKYLN